MDYPSLLLLLLLLLSGLGALLCALPWVGARLLPRLSIWVHVLLLVDVALITYESIEYGAGALEALDGWLRLDALGLLFVLLMVIGHLGVALYGRGYVDRALASGELTAQGLRRVYFFLHLVALAALFVPMASGMMAVWVGVGVMFLGVALLLGFGEKTVPEPERRYLLAVAVGLALALLGTLFYLWAASKANAREESPLAIKFLLDSAPRLDDGIVKLGFLFLLLGYGAQVGFWPAHMLFGDMQARMPAPLGGLLATSFGGAALYSILRAMGICARATGLGYPTTLLFVLGLLTLLGALWLLRGERDLTRVLVGWSVFQVGIILFSLGLGSRFGVYSGLHLLWGLGLVRLFLFLLSGEMLARAKSSSLDALCGFAWRSPALTVLFLLGLAAGLGLPPFGPFLGQWSLLASLALDAHGRIADAGALSAALGLPLWLAVLWAIWYLLLFVLLLLSALWLLGNFGIKVAFGKKPEEPPQPEPLPVLGYVGLGVPLLALLFLGVYLPEGIDGILDQAARLVLGQSK